MSLHQACFHHPAREAVARCPECGRFFCRECVTEHEGRMLCALCIQQLLRPQTKPRRWRRHLVRLTAFLASVTILWLFFYTFGKGLSSLPSTFHEKTFWEQESRE